MEKSEHKNNKKEEGGGKWKQLVDRQVSFRKFMFMFMFMSWSCALRHS